MSRPPSLEVLVTVIEVDRHTVDQFRSELGDAVHAFSLRGEPTAGDVLLVDLRETTFLDSSGVRALVDAERQLRSLDGRLEVVVTPGPVSRILEVSGVLDRWRVAD